MNEKRLSISLRALLGVECWGWMAGSGTGSMATIHFGRKIKRSKPVESKSLRDALKFYTGEYCLYLEECEWKIIADSVVLGSSASSNNREGKMLRALESLVGRRVTDLEFETDSKDFVLHFDGGCRMKIFCHTHSEETFDNYSFFVSDKIYTVTSDNEVLCHEKRN
jgi:hypothetical protein